MAQIVASIGAGECLNRAKIISGARQIINKSKVPGGNISFDAISAACWGASERERERETCFLISARRPMFRQDVALLSPAEQEEEGAPAKVIAAAVLMPLLFRVFRRLLQDAPLCIVFSLSHTQRAREHMACACAPGAIAKRRKRRCSITRAPSNYCRRAILALLFQNKRFCDRETDK